MRASILLFVPLLAAAPAMAVSSIVVSNSTLNVSTQTSLPPLIVYGAGVVNFTVPTCTVASLNGSGGGTVTLTADAVTLAGSGDYSGALYDSGSHATFVVNATQLMDGMQVGSLVVNGALQVHASATSANTTVLETLTLAAGTSTWTGGLDLTDNALILNPPGSRETAMATLQDQVTYGKTHAAGIYSKDLPAHTALAVLDNAVLNRTLFGNESVTSNSLMVAPTLIGDANADGVVDGNDLQIVMNHFGQPATAWRTGNFTGNARIDLGDLSCVLNDMGMRFTTFVGTSAASTVSMPNAPVGVPEPLTLSLLGMALPLLVARGRSRRGPAR